MSLYWDLKIEYGILECESAMGFVVVGYLEPGVSNGI